MSVNIRYPTITGLTEKEQLTQVKSYLHQLVEDLNYALPTLGTGDGSAQTSSSTQVQGSEMSYYDLRSLIVQQLQEVEKLFDELSSKMQSEYVKDEELSQAIESALTEAKESGEFDGPPGQDGYTPVKGVDYLTDDDIVPVATKAAEMISFSMDEEGNLYYEVIVDENLNNEGEEE